MIVVAGTALNPAALEDTYDSGSVQRALLNTMAKSANTYQYSNQSQLQIELDLRSEIVNAAYALNQSGLNFAGFHDTRCNEAYWTRTMNGGFRLNSGANAAAAISDIYTNGRAYATECATAMMIVYYKALLATLGETVFNQTFTSIYLMNWDIREPLLAAVGMIAKVDEMLLGDRGYFVNPDVNPQTPQWQGENVIVLPNNLYYGHGIGLTTADRIIRSLNANRKPGAAKKAHFIENKAGRPDFIRLSRLTARTRENAVPAAATGVLVWKPFPPPLYQI